MSQQPYTRRSKNGSVVETTSEKLFRPPRDDDLSDLSAVDYLVPRLQL